MKCVQEHGYVPFCRQPQGCCRVWPTLSAGAPDQLPVLPPPPCPTGLSTAVFLRRQLAPPTLHPLFVSSGFSSQPLNFICALLQHSRCSSPAFTSHVSQSERPRFPNKHSDSAGSTYGAARVTGITVPCQTKSFSPQMNKSKPVCQSSA